MSDPEWNQPHDFDPCFDPKGNKRCIVCGAPEDDKRHQGKPLDPDEPRALDARAAEIAERDKQNVALREALKALLEASHNDTEHALANNGEHRGLPAEVVEKGWAVIARAKGKTDE